jgi:hypothetical protein
VHAAGATADIALIVHLRHLFANSGGETDAADAAESS